MLELQCLFHIQSISPTPAMESLEHALFLSVANAPEDDNDVCFELLARLDASQKRKVRAFYSHHNVKFADISKICELSEVQVLSAVTVSSSEEQVTPQATNTQLQKYLRIIDCTSQGSLHDQDASFTTVIIEKLTKISNLISPNPDDIVAKSSQNQTHLIPDIESLCHW
jgi:hypothetical protein